MKIAPKQVSGFLAKPLESSHALLLYGPDSGLVRERMTQLSEKIIGKNADDFSTLELGESTVISDPTKLADELCAVSFLGGQRVIIIRDGSDKLTKILESAAEFMRGDPYVIVTSGELGPRSSLRSWFEKQTKAGAIACYQDEERDVAEIIRTVLSDAGMQISYDVVHYLATQLGNDRYVTRQELQKIITYAGEEKTISLEQARALVGYNRDADMDALVNAVADKNLAVLDKELKQLVNESVQPVQYLRALSRYFQRLYAIKLQTEHASIESVIQSLRPPVFFKQVPILTRHVKSWSIDAIAKALRLIAAAELACKTSDIPAIAASQRRLMQVTQVR